MLGTESKAAGKPSVPSQCFATADTTTKPPWDPVLQPLQGEPGLWATAVCKFLSGHQVPGGRGLTASLWSVLSILAIICSPVLPPNVTTPLWKAVTRCSGGSQALESCHSGFQGSLLSIQ